MQMFRSNADVPLPYIINHIFISPWTCGIAELDECFISIFYDT